MKNLEEVVSRIESELDEKDQVREIALKSSRAIVRLSGAILRGLHRNESPGEQLNVLKDEVTRLRSLLADHPELEHAGYVASAFQEYAEVGLIMSLLEKGDVPSPEELGVGSAPYLMGLGDSIGELRRFCLEELKAGRMVRANAILDMMEDLLTALMRFDYPDAIVPLRHKQDVARSLLEKTRGEVAVATSANSLHDKIEEILKRS